MPHHAFPLQHTCLLKSALDSHTYYVNDVQDPLARSLASLELQDVLLGAPPLHSSTTFEPGYAQQHMQPMQSQAHNDVQDGGDGPDTGSSLPFTTTAASAVPGRSITDDSGSSGLHGIGSGVIVDGPSSTGTYAGIGCGTCAEGEGMSDGGSCMEGGGGSPWRGLSSTLGDAFSRVVQVRHLVQIGALV